MMGTNTLEQGSVVWKSEESQNKCTLSRHMFSLAEPPPVDDQLTLKINPCYISSSRFSMCHLCFEAWEHGEAR